LVPSKSEGMTDIYHWLPSSPRVATADRGRWIIRVRFCTDDDIDICVNREKNMGWASRI